MNPRFPTETSLKSIQGVWGKKKEEGEKQLRNKRKEILLGSLGKRAVPRKTFNAGIGRQFCFMNKKYTHNTF